MYPGPMTTMNVPVAELLEQQADQVAAANPPSKVALVAVAFLFTVLGVVIGRTAFWTIKGVVFCVLAARYGYRIGMKAAVEPVPAPASQ